MTDPRETTIAKAPARWETRYGVVYCLRCGFSADYCRCGERSQDAAPDVGDGDFSSLASRIREVRRTMGGSD